jgi:serine protease Do
VERGWLGAVIQDLSEEMAKSFGYTGKDGILVSDVVRDTPAEKAGLRSEDIIVKYDGKSVAKVSDFRNMVAATAPNTEVELQVFRDGKMETLKATIARQPSQMPVAGNTKRQSAPDLGLTVLPLTPQRLEELGLDENLEGVLVGDVTAGSPADDSGIEPGDIIINVGGTPVKSVADFRAALKTQDIKRGIRIRVNRNGYQRFVLLRSK